MITSSIQNKFFWKILLDTNPYAKFSVSLTFGLGVS